MMEKNKAMNPTLATLALILLTVSGARAQINDKSCGKAETKACIESLTVRVGMTLAQVHKNWGFPDSTNTSTTRSGKSSTQMVYENKWGTTDFIYVNESGIVTATQIHGDTVDKRMDALEQTYDKDQQNRDVRTCIAKGTTQQERVACLVPPNMK
jgi:hypothetical protein